MAGDYVTLSVDGQVDLVTFSTALDSFRKLLDGLAEVTAAGYQIAWEITALDHGSAITTVRGIAESREAVLAVTRALDVVGESLQNHTAMPYGDAVQLPAFTLAGLADGGIHAVRLRTPENEYVLGGSSSMAAAELPAPNIDSEVANFGAVEGRIQTLSLRRTPRFTMFDTLDDRAVACYPEAEDQLSELPGLLGRVVVVEGWVRRDKLTGRPRSIRHITAITPVSEAEPLSWQRARGAVPREPETPRAEDVIRRLRDA